MARSDIDVNKQSFGFYDKNQTEINAPLHLAAKIGNIEIIRLLLGKKDICINIEDKCGKKPIDYAKNQEIKQLLSKWFEIQIGEDDEFLMPFIKIKMIKYIFLFSLKILNFSADNT